MNINATLLGQSVAFALFVLFCMNYVWPPIMRALEQRRQKIADGLAAAERGHQDQELARERSKQILSEARGQAADLVGQAQKRAAEIIDEAKTAARAEGERLLLAARAQAEQEMVRVREELRQQVANLAVAGASRILKKEIDAEGHRELLHDLVGQL